MFSVLIETRPLNGQWDAYLARANMLEGELEQAPGFVDDVRYRSLTRDGWILSLSNWRDESAVLRWHERTHDQPRDKGWSAIVSDYRVRVGEVTSDTRAAEARATAPRRPGEAAEGTYVTLIDTKQPPAWVAANNPQEIAIFLGFDLYSYGDCISWDIFEALSSPGAVILVVTWKDERSADDHAATQIVPDEGRVRVVRIVRDQPMFGPSDADADGETVHG